MSTIWIIREPRSGSTCFTEHVATRLGFNHCFLDSMVTGALAQRYPELGFNPTAAISKINKFSQNNTVFSTHFFNMLQIIDRFEDPIVIRCTRRNTLEQFLSYCLIKSTNYKFTSINPTERKTNQEQFDKLLDSHLLIPKKDVTEYMLAKSRDEAIWNEFAPKFKNFTVYYEDLCENGVDIPLLNMYNCKIDENGYTQKLPDYKTKVFLNYDMIQKWISEY